MLHNNKFKMGKWIQLAVVLSICCMKIQSIDSLFTSDQKNIYYMENERKYSWFDALTKCVSMDMSLVAIDTKEKSDEITALLKKTFGNVNEQWIGGVTNGNDHHFVWISTGDKVTFTNWAPGEPSFSHKNEYCLVTAWNKNFQWNDYECHKSAGLICEYSVHHHRQKELEAKLQEELLKEQQLQKELDKKQLQLEFLLNYGKYGFNSTK